MPHQHLSALSHELRTPLTAVLGYTDLLLDPDLDLFARRDAIRSIRRAGEQLVGVIDDMLEFASLADAAARLVPSPFAPRELLEELASAFRLRAQERGLNLETDWLGGTPPGRVTTDEGRVRRAIVRLVSYAVAHSASGTIRLFGRYLPGASPRLTLGIECPGDAVDPAMLGTEPAPEHLALAVTARTASLLGGGFDSFGSGTATYTLTFPVGGVDFHAMPAPLPEVPADPAKPLHGRRYLLAEDALDNQRVVQLFLAKAGATVQIVANGQLALDTARLGPIPFDAVLMDMQMPVMDGYEATRRLRGSGYAGVIVALTAHATSTDRQLCLEAGCDDFIAKPIDRKGLVERLARIAGTRAA